MHSAQSTVFVSGAHQASGCGADNNIGRELIVKRAAVNGGKQRGAIALAAVLLTATALCSPVVAHADDAVKIVAFQSAAVSPLPSSEEEGIPVRVDISPEQVVDPAPQEPAPEESRPGDQHPTTGAEFAPWLWITAALACVMAGVWALTRRRERRNTSR